MQVYAGTYHLALKHKIRLSMLIVQTYISKGTFSMLDFIFSLFKNDLLIYRSIRVYAFLHKLLTHLSHPFYGFTCQEVCNFYRINFFKVHFIEPRESYLSCLVFCLRESLAYSGVMLEMLF